MNIKNKLNLVELASEMAGTMLKNVALQSEIPEEDLFEEENDDGLLEKINTKIGDVIGKTKKRMHKFIKII